MLNRMYMGSNHSILIILIFGLIYNIHYCHARTCVCAEFVSSECNEVEYCKWKPITSTKSKLPSTWYSDGICRSFQWFLCHNDDECDTKKQTISRYDEYDWPFDCDSGVYANTLINVKSLEIAINDINSNGKTKILATSSSSSSDNKVSTETLIYVPVITVLVLIILVIAAFTYCKPMPKIRPSDDDSSEATESSQLKDDDEDGDDEDGDDKQIKSNYSSFQEMNDEEMVENIHIVENDDENKKKRSKLQKRKDKKDKKDKKKKKQNYANFSIQSDSESEE